MVNTARVRRPLQEIVPVLQKKKKPWLTTPASLCPCLVWVFIKLHRHIFNCFVSSLYLLLLYYQFVNFSFYYIWVFVMALTVAGLMIGKSLRLCAICAARCWRSSAHLLWPAAYSTLQSAKQAALDPTTLKDGGKITIRKAGFTVGCRQEASGATCISLPFNYG